MKHKFHSGVTLIELVVTMAISVIIISGVTVLLMSGNRSWQQTYDSATKKIKQDAQVVTIKFGSMGRKSNRLDYIIYDVNVGGGGAFIPVVPTLPQEVVSGDAVEFRYWDVGLDATDSHNLIDTTKTATAYALFYLIGGKLKVDYGPYPPGAVLVAGVRNTTNVTTTVLADNVSTDPIIGAFSHSTLSGVGQGSVRINIILTDPNDGDSIKVMTATLTRNIWPR